MARRAITKTYLLEGRRTPRNIHGSHAKELNKGQERMIRHFSYQDPPPKREKYTPLGLVMIAVEAAAPSYPFSQCSEKTHLYRPLLLPEILQVYEDQLTLVDYPILL